MNDKNMYGFPVERPGMQPSAGAEKTTQQSPLQQPAASMQMHVATVVDTKNFTVSVDEIRTRLQNLDVSKSKDTIQRYCREGKLDCEKLGIFKRYYATEKSVEKLIEILISDAGASNRVQVHTAVDDVEFKNVQVQKAAKNEDVPENNDLDAGASNSTQVFAGADNSADEKIFEMQQKQIDDKDKTISFLQEELVARRGAVSALEKIIDAFGDNAQASLLAAKNQERGFDRSDDQSVRREGDTSVVRDVHTEGVERRSDFKI